MPVFNRQEIIEDAIFSVVQQTTDSWELLIIDDESQDRSLDIAQVHAAMDSRIIGLTRGEGKGGNVCRNTGVKHANGDYIIFLDSDDLLLDTCMQQRLKVMEQHPEMDFAVFPGAVFSESPEYPEVFWNIENDHSNLERFLRFDSPWQTSGVIWRKSFLENENLRWDESLQIWQDVDFHIQALLRRPNYKVFWDASYDYLVRSSSTDSLSRSDYHAPHKTESRYIFWLKVVSLIKTQAIPADWATGLLTMVYRESIMKRNWKRAQKISITGLEVNIIDRVVYRTLIRTLRWNKLTMNKYGLKSLNIESSDPYVATIQKIPVRPTISQLPKDRSISL